MSSGGRWGASKTEHRPHHLHMQQIALSPPDDTNCLCVCMCVFLIVVPSVNMGNGESEEGKVGEKGAELVIYAPLATKSHILVQIQLRTRENSTRLFICIEPLTAVVKRDSLFTLKTFHHQFFPHAHSPRHAPRRSQLPARPSRWSATHASRWGWGGGGVG